ncbi:phage portal protein [Sulfitobacter sp. S190]|uniref:phage portal protein n=1 Tax=Sulfitobacter sp. S190 TaxID=2867022 RepID=UPI0021A6E7D7|nr:phage portal protein [Sulfitobacter sp. S190]UWR22627.1 phage portal protein [Sulfitobacter sp. S190]
MSFLNRIFGREQRSTITTSDPALAEFLGHRATGAAFVDPNRASGLAVAQACISVISQNLAAMPLNLYQRGEDSGRTRATSQPLYGALHDMMNPQLTAFEGREFLIVSLLTAGNAYARIDTNGRGQVTALYPIHPLEMTVERLDSGRLRYTATNTRGQRSVLLQDEILHLRYRIGPDGVMGVSPIQLARETFSLALTQQDQACKQAGRSFRTEGALVFPNPLSGDKKESALDKLRDRIEGQVETSGLLVLDGGIDYKPLSLSSKDAEFLESRKLTNMDIARIFSVPPTVVGITDNATYSNVDGESRALVVRCLAPMAKRVEQSLNAALLTPQSRRTLFIEHDLAGLMRGDMKARYEAYRVGREWGWLSPNEIRQMENLPNIDGGEEYLSPLNMTELGNRPAFEGGEDG